MTGYNFDGPTTDRILDSLTRTRKDVEEANQVQHLNYVREVDAGYVSAEISGGTGVGAGITPGTGKVISFDRIDYYDGAQGPMEYDVSNYFAATILIDTTVIIAKSAKGAWLLIATDCEEELPPIP